MTAYRVALSEDGPDGGWVAECLDLPGLVGEGESEQAAIDGLRSSISVYRSAVARKASFVLSGELAGAVVDAQAAERSGGAS